MNKKIQLHISYVRHGRKIASNIDPSLWGDSAHFGTNNKRKVVKYPSDIVERYSSPGETEDQILAKLSMFAAYPMMDEDWTSSHLSYRQSLGGVG